MKQHKHAELIKKWADGAEIQVFDGFFNHDWVDCYNPSWDDDLEYRIKNKFQELIDAWKNGAKIQLKSDNRWVDVGVPSWNPDWEYRIKHKHQEFIDAEKEGKQIQIFDAITASWVDKRVGKNFIDGFEYRIKPKEMEKYNDPSKEELLGLLNKTQEIVDILYQKYY